MLLFPLISLVIFTIVFIIHYKNHFKLVVSNRYKKRNLKLTPIGAKTFNFYPTSFLMYNVFNILLCITTIVIVIINAAIKQQNTLRVLFGMNLDQNINKPINTDIYVLMYAIMLLLIWDSLYSFHRYYATRNATIQLSISSSTIIFKRYIFFAIIFFVLYIIQIHLIYWVFPVIICLNFSFNIYCNLQFKRIIVKRCMDSIPKTSDNFAISSENQKFIQKANFLWNISLACCIIQSLSLGLLIGALKYNSNLLYFFPLFWCLSSTVWSMSFVRNRQYVKEHMSCAVRVEDEAIAKSIESSMDKTKSTSPEQESKNSAATGSVSNAVPTATETNVINIQNVPPTTAASEMIYIAPEQKENISRGSNDKSGAIDASIQHDLPSIDPKEVNIISINEVKLVGKISESLTVSVVDIVSTEQKENVSGSSDKNEVIYVSNTQDLSAIKETEKSSMGETKSVVQNDERIDGDKELNVHEITLQALKAYGFF